MLIISLGGGSDLQLFVNDLSIAGQFSDITQFSEAIGRLMRMRNTAKQFSHTLQCHRDIVNTQVTSKMMMQQAVQMLPPNERQALMQWLTRDGPFWDDSRKHSDDDYFECEGEIVTGNAVSEAAYFCSCGNDCQLVSLIPSKWDSQKLFVDWYISDEIG